MKYKITFFNPVNLKTRHYWLSFVWDAMNHRWTFLVKSDYNESDVPQGFRSNPEDFVRRYVDALKRRGEYETVKKVA